MGAGWGEVWVPEAGGTYYGGYMLWLSDQALIKTLKVNVTTCVALLWERNYHEMSNISKDVNIFRDTITITVRMRRVSFERADLLGPLVGRSVGITRLRNIQHTSTNETIPFYKTLPNIFNIYVYFYKWNHPCSTLLYPYHTSTYSMIWHISIDETIPSPFLSFPTRQLIEILSEIKNILTQVKSPTGKSV